MPLTAKALTLTLAASLSIALASLLTGACADADAAAPTSSPTIPLAALTPSGETLVGHVSERLPAGSYVYLAIRGDDGVQRWAVVMGDAPPVGAAITARSMGKRADFHSARLQRTFPELHFASLKAPRSI